MIVYLDLPIFESFRADAIARPAKADPPSSADFPLPDILSPAISAHCMAMKIAKSFL